MTYADIVSEARTLLQDAVEPYRFPSLEMYGYVERGLISLFSIRPSAFFVDGRMPTAAADMEPPTAAVAEAASGASLAPVSGGSRYRSALAYFVASKCLERDDTDTQNTALASAYTQNFAAFARA